MAALITLATVLMLAVPALSSECGFWYPVLDVTQQVTSLSADSFREAVTSGQTLVVHFMVPSTDDPLAKREDRIYEQMLETTLLSMIQRNVSVATVNMVDNQNLTQEEGVTAAGTIHVYKWGQKYVYSGYRSAEALISFLYKLYKPIVTVIDGKIQKKVFDHEQGSKVVGYFQSWPTGPEMTAYEAAARAHYPMVPFYAVFDTAIATSMRFTTPGEILVRRPFEKVGLAVPQNPATEADITSFLQANGQPFFQRVTLEDGPAVWHAQVGARQVAFARCRSPVGGALVKVFKDMIKQGTLQTATQKTVILIDPEDFPTLTNHWETTFGLDLRLPALGLVNVTNNHAVWADLTGFAGLTRPEQIGAVTVWLEAVSQDKIRVDGLPRDVAQTDLDALARAAVEAAHAAAHAAHAAAEAARIASQAHSHAAAQQNSPAAAAAEQPAVKQASVTEGEAQEEGKQEL